jgi:hypothetical protein
MAAICAYLRTRQVYICSMHAFITDLPDNHAIAGLSPAANTALVVCGYHPGERWYYGMVAGAPTALTTKPDLYLRGLSLSELVWWLEKMRIGLPGGLHVRLRLDGYKGSAQTWQKYYWGEQGPELRGLVDPHQDRAASFVPLFFEPAQAQRAA